MSQYSSPTYIGNQASYQLGNFFSPPTGVQGDLKADVCSNDLFALNDQIIREAGIEFLQQLRETNLVWTPPQSVEQEFPPTHTDSSATHNQGWFAFDDGGFDPFYDPSSPTSSVPSHSSLADDPIVSHHASNLDREQKGADFMSPPPSTFDGFDWLTNAGATSSSPLLNFKGETFSYGENSPVSSPGFFAGVGFQNGDSAVSPGWNPSPMSPHNPGDWLSPTSPMGRARSPLSPYRTSEPGPGSPLRDVKLETQFHVTRQATPPWPAMSTPWNGSKVCSPEPEPRHETAPSPRTILVPKPVRQQRQQSTSTARRRRHNPDAFVELMQKILSEPPEKGHETLSHALDQLAVKLADLGMTDRCVAFIRSEREREKGVHARQWFETHEPDQTAKHARMMGRRFGAMDEDEESGNMDDGDWEPDDLVHGSHFESIFGV